MSRKMVFLSDNTRLPRDSCKATHVYQKTSRMALHLTSHLMMNEFCLAFLNNGHLPVVFDIKDTNQALPPMTGLK